MQSQEVLNRLMIMKPATIVFLVSQLALAAISELWRLSDDGDPINWSFVRDHWTLLAWAQVLAVSTGVWEGLAGATGRRRLIVWAIGPVTLVAWFFLLTFYFPGAPGLWKILVLLPSSALASSVFAPSWVGIAAGACTGACLQPMKDSAIPKPPFVSGERLTTVRPWRRHAAADEAACRGGTSRRRGPFPFRSVKLGSPAGLFLLLA
jgi:hypothetical protein